MGLPFVRVGLAVDIPDVHESGRTLPVRAGAVTIAAGFCPPHFT